VLLVEYLGPQKDRVILLGILLTVNIGIQLVNPQIIRHFIDIAQSAAALSKLTQVALVFVAAAITQQLVETVATYVSETISWTSTNRLRSSLARHCLHLDTQFHNEHTPGEMIERIDGDVNALGNFFSRFILQILGNLVLMICSDSWKSSLQVRKTSDPHAPSRMCAIASMTSRVPGIAVKSKPR
jgi:ATP-binding cassette subfamily B protein